MWAAILVKDKNKYLNCIPMEKISVTLFNQYVFAPGFCFCKDDPEVQIDARPQFFSSVLDLCPKGEINR